jgi:hypothetical protein
MLGLHRTGPQWNPYWLEEQTDEWQAVLLRLSLIARRRFHEHHLWLLLQDLWSLPQHIPYSL